MGVDRPIDITADQRKTLLALLKRHLPNTTAWVYGSRVKWTSRLQSDLDLVVFTTPEQNRRVSDLREAFEESNLPFRVDLFVWDTVPEQFRKQIEAEHVVIVKREERGVGGKTLANFVSITMGQSPPGNTVFSVGRVPLLNGPTEFGPHHPTPTQFTTSPRKYAHPGDILFCVRGSTTGRMNWANQEYAIGRGIAAIRHRQEFALQPFVRAVIECELAELLAQATGSTFPNVAASQLAEIPYPDLDIDKQRAIAHILGTLDDKIELNRRMNETLEAMARALFKSWFIDFDPVRAKLAGRDPGLPQYLADLFPDRLVDSELGPIPDGWEVGCLADIATAPRHGVDPASLHGETPYIGLEHMPRHSIALTEWENAGKVTSNKSVFDKGEVLFGKLRPYFHKVGIAPVSGVCSTDIVVIAPKTVEWSAFVLACVASTEFVAYTNQTSTGTKMPRTSWNTMGRYPLCLPARPVAQAFQNAAQPHMDGIVANIHHARLLAALRDALLPKLISGEMRIRKADIQMETIV